MAIPLHAFLYRKTKGNKSRVVSVYVMKAYEEYVGTERTLHASRVKWLHYPLSRRLGGPQSSSGHFEGKSLAQ